MSGRRTTDNQIQSDHDLLISIKTELGFMREEIKNGQQSSAEKIGDHEVRLRLLEKWGWKAAGALALGEFIIGIYISLRH